MTAHDRRLVALAAAFLPQDAERLLGRRVTADAQAVADAAAHLARAPQSQRLAILAQALSIQDEPRAVSQHVERLVRSERPRLRSALRILTTNGSGPIAAVRLAPLLARLCAEQLTRSP